VTVEFFSFLIVCGSSLRYGYDFVSLRLMRLVSERMELKLHHASVFPVFICCLITGLMIMRACLHYVAFITPSLDSLAGLLMRFASS